MTMAMLSPPSPSLRSSSRAAVAPYHNNDSHNHSNKHHDMELAPPLPQMPQKQHGSGGVARSDLAVAMRAADELRQRSLRLGDLLAAERSEAAALRAENVAREQREQQLVEELGELSADVFVLRAENNAGVARLQAARAQALKQQHQQQQHQQQQQQQRRQQQQQYPQRR
jgi:hypothetical protein